MVKVRAIIEKKKLFGKALGKNIENNILVGLWLGKGQNPFWQGFGKNSGKIKKKHPFWHDFGILTKAVPERVLRAIIQ